MVAAAEGAKPHHVETSTTTLAPREVILRALPRVFPNATAKMAIYAAAPSWVGKDEPEAASENNVQLNLCDNARIKHILHL